VQRPVDPAVVKGPDLTSAVLTEQVARCGEEMEMSLAEPDSGQALLAGLLTEESARSG